MKRILQAIAILPFILLAKHTTASAQSPEYRFFQPNRIFVGGSYTRVHLKPHITSSLNGNMGGANAIYEYRPANAFYAAAVGQWSKGSVKGASGHRNLMFAGITERLGYSWQSCHSLWTLYSGAAFRFLGHDITPSSSAVGAFNSAFFPPFLSGGSSIKLDHYDIYFPVGGMVEYVCSCFFSLSVCAEWRAQAYSTLQIRPLGGTYWTLKNTFGNCLIQVPFRFFVGTCRHSFIEIVPFYELWHDGHSTAESSTGVSLGAPQNTYNMYGVNLNYLYQF